jgi:hypothetical protein
VADGQGTGVLGAQDPLLQGQQGSELIAGPSRIPHPSGLNCQFVAGGQGLPMLGAQDLLMDGQQGSELTTSPSPS